jgi:PAS domain S-box-containing protein
LLKDRIYRYYEDIVETIHEPLLVLDSDLKIFYANRNFYDTFKATPEKTVGFLVYDIGNQQWDIPKLRTLLEEILPKHKKFDNYEVEHEFPTIGHKIMLLNARRITHKGIGSELILLAIEDITERRRLEGLLVVSEERYRRLFETANDGILLLEKSEGKITHANPAATKMLGYSKEEFIGNNLGDVGFPPGIGDIQETLHALEKDGIIYYDDAPVKTKAGPMMDTDIYLVDRARLIQCNIRDITYRKRAEKALGESEQRYRTFINATSDMVYFKDDQFRHLIVNQALADFFGKDQADIIGKTDFELMPMHAAETCRANDMQAIRAKSVVVTKEQIGDRIYETTKFPVPLQDDRMGLGGIIRDITERKQAEEALLVSTERLRKSLGGTVQAMASVVETRDPYTAGHQRRVSVLARAIATEMNLPSDQIDGLRMAAVIHDIGKISVPAEILSKPTKLSAIEFGLIKVHPQSGYEILKDIEFPWPVARIVLEHHERMDGSGYPNGLTGGKLLIESRILTVADVVESMSSHRPYRPALGLDAALDEIRKNKGVLYDPVVVDACLRLFHEKGYKLAD